MEHKTQEERVLQYMRDYGSITPMDAIYNFSITRLGARIFELKKKGYRIKSDRVAYTNKYGEKRNFTRYSLEE